MGTEKDWVRGPNQTQKTLQWHNWSGSVQAKPREIVRPRSIDELARKVEEYGRNGRRIRVVGTGHSFTPLAQSDDILISLDDMQGVEPVKIIEGGEVTEKMGGKDVTQVSVLGGTKIHYLSEQLFACNLAQENLGDIDVQSISGAISTGTHGTGVSFGTLSTQVTGITLVTATGELLECSAEKHPEIFKAAQVSLGMLGIIARLQLRVVPAQRLHFKSQRKTLDDCLTNLERYKQENDHFEFFWFPYTEWVQAKLINSTQAPANTGGVWGNFNKVVLENGLYWLLSEGCRLMPGLCKKVSNISALGVATVDEVDYSHRLFATPRWVRFNEMEYNIPAEYAVTVLREIQECVKQQHFAVHFPVECRFVRADDIWLSPAYQRDSCYMAIHMYKGMEYLPYFQQIEQIFKRYQGRPHWGKMHWQNAQSLAGLYPRWYDFQRVRTTLDPQGIFLNDYLRTLFDVDSPASSEGQV